MPDKPPPLPPPSLPGSKKKTNQEELANRWWRAHGWRTGGQQSTGVGVWRDRIEFWSTQYGLDPLKLAAIILNESGGRRDALRKETDGSVSYGIVQINTARFGQKTAWGETLGKAFALNADKSIRYIAQQISVTLPQVGNSYTNFYQKSWNPGSTVDPIARAGLPKAYSGYTPRGTRASPGERASLSAEYSGEKQAITDPWVVLRKGRIVGIGSVNPPKDAVTALGAPITRSQYKGLKTNWDDIYIDYVGRRARDGEIIQILKQGWSVDVVRRRLSQNPDFFTKGSLWKSQAPGYLDVARSIYGDDLVSNNIGKGGVLRELTRKAVIYGWQQGAYEGQLRQHKLYTQSNEFKSNEQKMSNLYRQIYGEPDNNSRQFLKEITLGGWDGDQLQKYLESLPEYEQSVGYRRREQEHFRGLGQLTGRGYIQTGATGEEYQSGRPEPVEPLPDTRRIAGAPKKPRPTRIPGINTARGTY